MFCSFHYTSLAFLLLKVFVSILINAVVNGIAFLILFSDYSLQMCRNTTAYWSCILVILIAIIWICPPKVHMLETQSPNLYVDDIWKWALREVKLEEIMRMGAPMMELMAL